MITRPIITRAMITRPIRNKEVRRTGAVVAAGLAVVGIAALIFVRGGGLDTFGTGGEELSVLEATDQYLNGNPEPGEALASEAGTIYAYSKEDFKNYEAKGTLSVLAVDAGESSTHVRFSISAESEIYLNSGEYRGDGTPGFRSAKVFAEQANLSLTGAQWTGPNDGQPDCTCGRLPESVGPAGVEVSLLFPVLPDSVEKIQLSIPGFVPLTVPIAGR